MFNKRNDKNSVSCMASIDALCAQMNDAMQELTGIKYEASEQHKDTRKSKQTYMMTHICYIKLYL